MKSNVMFISLLFGCAIAYSNSFQPASNPPNHKERIELLETKVNSLREDVAKLKKKTQHLSAHGSRMVIQIDGWEWHFHHNGAAFREPKNKPLVNGNANSNKREFFTSQVELR